MFYHFFSQNDKTNVKENLSTRIYQPQFILNINTIKVKVAIK